MEYKYISFPFRYDYMINFNDKFYDIVFMYKHWLKAYHA